MLRNQLIALSLGLGLSFVAARADADDAPQAPHGPTAPGDKFPSHHFQLEAHQPDRVQVGANFGLLQPIVLHGFNVAVDVRYKRLVATYSHGQALNTTPFLKASEKAAGMTLHEPWTTGGGLGIVLIDELWVLADVKVHRFEADTRLDHEGYTNVTVGGEVGWRYFIWRGLNVGVVGRYWPNVYSSAGKGITLRDNNGKPFLHEPAQQGVGGVFGNVLLGWSFGT